MTLSSVAHHALTDARTVPFWLDSPRRPDARRSLSAGKHATDLAIVGAGFSGLWTAVLAKERDPGRRVLLIEGERIGWAASGRNGGFCSASLTHGHPNGAQRFPDEIDILDKLGRQNLDEIEATLAREDIDCGFHRPGLIAVATQAYQIEELRRSGHEFLDQSAVRARLNSPTYLAGLFEPDDTALLDPARLAWGLAAAAERRGVEIVENTRVMSMSNTSHGVELATAGGAAVHAARVALGTNAFPSLLRRTRLFTVPVYDYVLMTEPLSSAQLGELGWAGREGFDEVSNQFHYYRLTADNRILWGGYDAIYHFGRRVKPGYDQRTSTFETLARQFLQTFPQLTGICFTHKWGGAIDTCTRFCAFYGSALSGRVAYAAGYTGLGVGATRFGANVMLDLLDGVPTERTSLDMVRTKPLPFPPEPLAYLGIQVTRAALAAADRNNGRRNLWLRSLDRLGLGFDS